jgi:hypothetical protein
MIMRRGWHRVRGTEPGVQTWECEPFGTEVVQADAGAVKAGDEQLKHAEDQLGLASQYPGRSRSLPSGGKVIVLDPAKR